MYLHIAEHDFVSKWNISLLITLHYFVLFHTAIHFTLQAQ